MQASMIVNLYWISLQNLGILFLQQVFHKSRLYRQNLIQDVENVYMGTHN